MVANQGCKKCRSTFSEDSDERNYSNYARFGFKSEEKFRKHNAGNKNCPCKQSNQADNIHTQEQVIPQNHIPLWSPPVKNTDLIEDEDYIDDQEKDQIRLKKHNRRGNYGSTSFNLYDI